MTPNTLDQLKELAAKATPGPWTAVSDLPSFGVAAEHPHPDPIATVNRAYRAPHRKNLGCWENDARFIAAFNPQVALALLANTVALHELLSNVSLDWYAAQFRRDERPTRTDSGVVAKIANAETEARAKVAFAKARDALEKLKEAGVTI